MTINKELFYKKLRTVTLGEDAALPLFKKLFQQQIDGFEIIFTRWEQSQYTDLRWLAYMLATVYHETCRTMQPIEEYGHGAGRPYGVPDALTGKCYYGRGYVQLTWKANYLSMGRKLNVDLVNYPNMALEAKVAVEVLFEGMTKANSTIGDFTGRCLEMYFDEKTEDWMHARRIINGLDRAGEIANYGRQFFECLN